MAKRTATVVIHTCDGCGKDVQAPDEDAIPAGYHGIATLISGAEVTPKTQWFACRYTCIQAAVMKVCGTTPRTRTRNGTPAGTETPAEPPAQNAAQTATGAGNTAPESTATKGK